MDYDGIPVDENTIDHMIHKRICGQPQELTESSPETYYVRDLLEKEGTYKEYDFGGSVWWNKDKTAAIVRF